MRNIRTQINVNTLQNIMAKTTQPCGMVLGFFLCDDINLSHLISWIFTFQDRFEHSLQLFQCLLVNAVEIIKISVNFEKCMDLNYVTS